MLTWDEGMMVRKYMDLTDAKVYYRQYDKVWVISDWYEDATYDTKQELMEVIRYNISEIEKQIKKGA